MAERVITLVVESNYGYSQLSIQRLLPDGSLTDPILIYDSDDIREILGYAKEDQ
jgi:hypothetical protein